LGIDTSNIPKTKKVGKGLSEEEAEKVRAENDEIRKQREASADVIANKFACFKRDFMGAPIWATMQDILNKKDPKKPCQINYRADERFWVFPSKEEVSVTFEVNLGSKED
jgi:phosphopantetheinyl transferase (holo-ACP synthase)